MGFGSLGLRGPTAPLSLNSMLAGAVPHGASCGDLARRASSARKGFGRGSMCTAAMQDGPQQILGFSSGRSYNMCRSCLV